MNEYHFSILTTCPLHLTYRGVGNTPEEALENAKLIQDCVDGWASQNDSDFDISQLNIDDCDVYMDGRFIPTNK